MFEIVSGDYVGRWVAERINGTFHDGSEAIGLRHGPKMFAGVIYENWNRTSIVCHIAVERMTPRFLAAIFHYPFIYLSVGKIICPVAQSNFKSRRLVENMGFNEEAKIRDAHPDGDLLIYTMTKEACRFITEPYQQRLAAGGS